jgi:hypothetical protein
VGRMSWVVGKKSWVVGKKSWVKKSLVVGKKSWVVGKKSWVKSRGSWVKSRGSRIKSRVSREKSRGSREKKSWVPNKKSWVLRKCVGSKQNTSIYLPFSLWNACFFSSEVSQIYIVLERVKAGFLISADRFINIITQVWMKQFNFDHAPYSSNIWTL